LGLWRPMDDTSDAEDFHTSRRTRCPLEQVTGETVDIAEYLDFGFYDRISYKENTGLGETATIICPGSSN
jgi:hypothetical protein